MNLKKQMRKILENPIVSTKGIFHCYVDERKLTQLLQAFRSSVLSEGVIKLECRMVKHKGKDAFIEYQEMRLSKGLLCQLIGEALHKASLDNITKDKDD